MKKLWYKDAIIYGIDVKTFQDSNNDGIGDFPGLISRLDYLSDLGINCIWLLPFYPSPNKDNGYDVSDFYNVDLRLGTLDSFSLFIKECHKRHIRVIIDLAAHHTSTEHPWFKAARSDEKSIYRDYYVWSKSRPKNNEPGSAFPGEENTVWHYDEVAKAWYFHKFYYFQPDLNYKNVRVQQEVLNITNFWLAFGIDGLRIDAAGLLFSSKGLPYTKHKTPWVFLKKLNKIVEDKNAVLLGEADTWPEEMSIFFGEGNRIHMLLNFLLNQSIFAALAAEDAGMLAEMFQSIPILPKKGEWVNFIRNLDELNINKLPKRQQDLVYEKFGRNPKYQIYHRGLRRRVAPMLGNNPDQLKMVFTLLFGLPGVPLICYGDELGMGEDITLPERDPVRTSMQWSDAPNAGFSRASGQRLWKPVIAHGKYGYKNINVEAAKKDENSLYHTIKRMIKLRKKLPILGSASPKIIKLPAVSILCLRYDWKGKSLVLFFNLSDCPLGIDLKEFKLHKKSVEVLSDKKYPKVKEINNPIGAYGYRWFYFDK